MVPATVLLLCACRKPKQEPPQPEFQVVAASATVAAAAPSDTAASAPASAVASASASAAGPASPAPTATELGMIGLIATDGGVGAGGMFGDAIGDTFGTGGLGLSGLDGGGSGGAIGLGTIGTLGHGAGGTGTGTGGSGFGSGHGRLGRGHQVHGARMRQGLVTVNGRLPPEVIQRIVRRSFARMRYCYEQGLMRDPNLSGNVVVRFVVEGQGNVSSARSDSSTALSDAAVVACVVRAFSSMAFPKPEGGIVTVLYPISFSAP
jgi:hypothetical protein